MNSLIVAMTEPFAVCGACSKPRENFYEKEFSATKQQVASPFRRHLAGKLKSQIKNLCLGGAAVLAVIIFIGSNPALYVDPVDGVHALSYEHALTADIREDILGGR